MSRRVHSLAELEKDQWVRFWHDTGAFSWVTVYGRVVRVNKKSVTVKWELRGGEVKRLREDRLHVIEKASREEAEAVLREAGLWALFEDKEKSTKEKSTKSGMATMAKHYGLEHKSK